MCHHQEKTPNAAVFTASTNVRGLSNGHLHYFLTRHSFIKKQFQNITYIDHFTTTFDYFFLLVASLIWFVNINNEKLSYKYPIHRRQLMSYSPKNRTNTSWNKTLDVKRLVWRLWLDDRSKSAEIPSWDQAVIWTREICFQSELGPAEMSTVTAQHRTAAGQQRVGLILMIRQIGLDLNCSFPARWREDKRTSNQRTS